MEKNKVVIISGGTSGIGLATAKILASEGWKTILLGRDMSKGRGAQEEAQGSIFIPCDVTNTRIVKNAIEKAASFGEIRGVVSCAGIYTEGLLDNVTDEEMQKFFELCGDLVEYEPRPRKEILTMVQTIVGGEAA